MEGNKRKKWVAIFFCIFFGILFVLTFFSNTIRTFSLPEVRTTQVSGGELSLAVRGTGIVEGSGDKVIMTEVTGQIKTVYVTKGMEIHPGDVIAEFYNVNLEKIAELQSSIAERTLEYEKIAVSSNLSIEELTLLEAGERKTLSELLLIREEKEEAYDKATEKVKAISDTLIELNRQLGILSLEQKDTDEVSKAITENNALLSYASNEQLDCQNEIQQTENWIQDYLSIASMLDKISSDQTLLEEISNSAENFELISTESGIISDIFAGEGDFVQEGDNICLVRAENTSYYMKIQVSKSQASSVSVGSEARTSGYWSSEGVSAIVESIEQNIDDPGIMDITFKLHGNLTLGQSLTLVVDGSTGNYEQLVPNQAIYTDAEGKFVWILETQRGALGNKYTAVRCPVQVLAIGETRSAVYGEIPQNTYIITNSSAPIVDGQQVRINVDGESE